MEHASIEREKLTCALLTGRAIYGFGLYRTFLWIHNQNAPQGTTALFVESFVLNLLAELLLIRNQRVRIVHEENEAITKRVVQKIELF